MLAGSAASVGFVRIYTFFFLLFCFVSAGVFEPMLEHNKTMTSFQWQTGVFLCSLVLASFCRVVAHD